MFNIEVMEKSGWKVIHAPVGSKKTAIAVCTAHIAMQIAAGAINPLPVRARMVPEVDA